jgi:glycosyltransferase involved in cell wall biosynthesis
MKLLIAIPAFNEESSIETIIQRSLDARGHIIRNSPVTDVEIRVVSDGSSDRTVELASRYADRIELIIFEQNRGYGAAIKEAWKDTDADLLGFLDADGTCDPRFFSNLCSALVDANADLALGCRLNKHTQMPAIRQVGNLIIASILTMAARKRVRDTASGMRVVRRHVYGKLLPLPNGLHFTPAMTARALLGAGGGMKLIEIDMPYYEREGKSKLKVLRDGSRFLRIILEAVFLYHPARPLAAIGCACFVIAIALMATPVMHYWKTRTVDEWMLYRFILGHLAGISAFLMFAVALLCRRVVQMTIGAQTGSHASKDWINRAFLSRFYWVLPVSCIACGGALAGANLFAHVASGAAYEHWSRFIAMSFFFLLAIIFICARVVAYLLELVSDQLAYLECHAKVDDSQGATDAYAAQ